MEYKGRQDRQVSYSHGNYILVRDTEKHELTKQKEFQRVKGAVKTKCIAE